MLEKEAIRRAYHGVEKPITVAGKREIIHEYSCPADIPFRLEWKLWTSCRRLTLRTRQLALANTVDST